MSHLEKPYPSLLNELQLTIPGDRLITDPLRTLAFGTDASFYRLTPQVVIKAETEEEIVAVIQVARRHGVSVTFRAAGTSLSGQAISDAILVIAGTGWRRYDIFENGRRIRLQPGIIGSHANRFLAPYGRKIGPDPASINAAMIGGILANNASGMCCGVAENSYQTVESLRLILSDGTLLDTSDDMSRQAFTDSHGPMLEKLSALAARVRSRIELVERIRHKFKIKNTTGYSLNALIDFEDPFDIMVHLMVGSEGTLGFVSEVIYRTVVEHPFKASSLMIFDGIEGACRMAAVLKATPVSAVELMDRAAMRSVEEKPGMPGLLRTLPPAAAALLVETRGGDDKTLAANMAEIVTAVGCDPAALTESGVTNCMLESSATLYPVRFTTDAGENARLWNIRKGLFPSVGAMRCSGTTVIIEDVAFPIHHLPAATLELQQLLQKHQYGEAIIFGHALEGNLHFVFTQDFSIPSEVERYRRFMQEVCDMVVARYDGSLKAEHGTGRNMAPFVELEWGREAYGLMEEIKAIFDPNGLFNPGVILNADPKAHLRHLKPLPAAHPLVDKCIECGFCEETCPSKELTLTPRHRIVVQREIARLQKSGGDPERLAQLLRAYAYNGEQTCAADGLCALSCPVEINTGTYTKFLRSLNVGGRGPQFVADMATRHFHLVTGMARLGLSVIGSTHRLLSTGTMERLIYIARKLLGNRLPHWSPYLPEAAQGVPASVIVSSDSPKVVYFPSCVSRTMGPADGDRRTESLIQVTQRVLSKAGFNIVHPPDMGNLCCGMPFESKGFLHQADAKASELNRALLRASDSGRFPVLCDTSPCIERMRRTLDAKLHLYEPVEFVWNYLLPRLDITKRDDAVALHVTCSARKMGLAEMFVEVARQCAAEVIVPEQVDCCGFAGDRGFTHPELNRSALKHLKAAVSGVCRDGYSNSRTCEIGLSEQSGIYYRSILYLLDECT